MQSVVGIFPSMVSAERAVRGLLSIGMTERSIVFVSTGSREDSAVRVSSEKELDRVPTTDAESDGIGKAMGALLGGAVGASAGLASGAAMASLLVPGVGTIFALGVGAAAVLGLGGAAAGAKAGDAAEHAMDVGVPRDEVKFYHEVLRRGRSLVIANADGEELAERARTVFKEQGGEDVGAARKEFEKAA
ncbi:MAG: hypothetical protein WB799_14425 [Candidatus Sulfotelmatobacter sp.]